MLAGDSSADPPGREQELARTGPPPSRHAIGKPGEHADHDVIFGRLGDRAVPSTRRGALLSSRARRVRRPRFRASRSQRIRRRISASCRATVCRSPSRQVQDLPPRPIRESTALKMLDGLEHVGAAGDRAARAARLALPHDRGELARRLDHPAVLGLDDDPRQPRMKRKAEHAPADRRDSIPGDRAEAPEERLGSRERRRLGRLEPVERADAQRAKREHGLGEIGAPDLGNFIGRPRVVIVLRVKTHAAPGSRAPGAARALRRRRLADFLHAQRGQARPRRMTRHARQPAVDHGDHARNRHRALGDIRRQDDLPLRRRPDRAILLGGCQVTMQRDDLEIEARGDLGERRARPPHLGPPRQEHQDNSLEVVLRQPPHGRRDLRIELALVGLARVLDRDLEPPTFRTQRRATTEERRHRSGVEGRRHRDDAQRGPLGLLQAAEERERQIGVQMTLVQLVEDHRADPAERRIAEHAAEQDPLGDEADPSARPADLLEANLVADRLPQLLAELLGDPPRRQSGGESAWLEHDDLAVDRVEERGRNAGRLARARRRLDDEISSRGADRGQDRVDREGRERGRGQAGRCGVGQQLLGAQVGNDSTWLARRKTEIRALPRRRRGWEGPISCASSTTAV